MGLIPVQGRSPGGRHGNPLQYSCLEKPTDRGVWQAIVHRVAKSQTQLKHLARARTHTHTHTHTHTDIWGALALPGRGLKGEGFRKSKVSHRCVVSWLPPFSFTCQWTRAGEVEPQNLLGNMKGLLLILFVIITAVGLGKMFLSAINVSWRIIGLYNLKWLPETKVGAILAS